MRKFFIMFMLPCLLPCIVEACGGAPEWDDSNGGSSLVCVPRLTEGEDCRKAAGVSQFPCAEGLYCDENNICRLPPAEGEPCQDEDQELQECATELHCDHDICRSFADEGEHCEIHDCAEGLYCHDQSPETAHVSGICRPLAVEDAACDRDAGAPCADGFYCDAGVCLRTHTLGDACRFEGGDIICGEGLYCDENLICSPMVNGMECASWWPCADGFYCCEDPNRCSIPGFNGVCRALDLAEGERCTAGALCAYGLYCDKNHFCRSLLVEGEEGCSDGFDPCAEGLYCHSGTCVPRLSEGASCYQQFRNGDCLAAFYCNLPPGR